MCWLTGLANRSQRSSPSSVRGSAARRRWSAKPWPRCRTPFATKRSTSPNHRSPSRWSQERLRLAPLRRRETPNGSSECGGNALLRLAGSARTMCWCLTRCRRSLGGPRSSRDCGMPTGRQGARSMLLFSARPRCKCRSAFLRVLRAGSSRSARPTGRSPRCATHSASTATNSSSTGVIPAQPAIGAASGAGGTMSGTR